MVRLFALLAIAVMAALPARAAITSVDVSPGAVAIDGVGSGIVTLRWRVSFSGPAQTLVITSPSGTLDAGVQASVSAGGPLRRSIRHPGGSGSVIITERLRIDRTSARYILDVGDGTFYRQFSDGQSTPLSASVEIEARSTGSGGISLQNFTLAFDDRTQYRVVERGAALTGFVTVTNSGRGVFEGIWELAGPSGGFRPIGRERIVMSGPRATTFESPALPSDGAGQYRLRFRAGGDGASPSPVITYVVVPSTGQGAVTLFSPSPGTRMTGATRFEWGTVPGAARYRVEFLTPGNSEPIAAVDATGTSTTLRPFTLARLRSRGQIVWRVTAFSAHGVPVARSQSRVLGAGGTVLQGSP
jgi:hypothetical protein